MVEQRESNGLGQGWIRDVPVWVKALAFFIGMVGFPVFFAVFTMGQAAGWIPSIMSQNATRIDTLTTEVKSHTESQNTILKDYLVSEKASTDRLVAAISIICENQSKTIAERNNCRNIR